MPTIFGFDGGNVAAIASAIFAFISLGFAFWSGNSALRSSEASASSYRLNAAKEWADRAGGVEYEHALIGYACKELKYSVSSKFALGGALHSSARIEIEEEIEQLRAGAQAIKDEHEMTVVPQAVLRTSSGQQFASLVAELEFDRSRIRAFRTRLESLRDDFSVN